MVKGIRALSNSIKRSDLFSKYLSHFYLPRLDVMNIAQPKIQQTRKQASQLGLW
jgi:hypothetical protein